jgi:hypothetical protein
MTGNKSKKGSSSLNKRKRVKYVLKKKPAKDSKPEAIVTRESFAVSIKDMIRENVFDRTNRSRSKEEYYRGCLRTGEDEFETEFSKFLKRTHRTSRSPGKVSFSSMPSSPKFDSNPAVSTYTIRRPKKIDFGTKKSMAPDSDVKIYRSNLKYSSIWDLIQIFEKRKKIFSQPKPSKKENFCAKSARQSIDMKVKNDKNCKETNKFISKTQLAEYFQSKKDVNNF